MRKKITRLGTLGALALMFLLSGCVYYGRDGQPGDVFIEVHPSPHFLVEYYWDNNPSVPPAFYWGYFYPSAPGIYEYEYALSDEFLYWGEYSMVPNAGQPGGPGYDGARGLNRYYSLYLYSGGGFVDWYSRNPAELQDLPLRDGMPYEVLSDTTIHMDGFDLVMTRNRMPVGDIEMRDDAKFVREK